MEDLILKAITEFGFSAVVAFYLLTKTTKAIENNTKAINALKEKIDRIISK